jgi:hypothetical protein
MRARTIVTVMLSSAILTACAGRETLRTVDSGCLAFKALSYANAPLGQERADDPGNRYDTPETQAAIDEHDAVFERLCRPSSNPQASVSR